MTVPPLARRAAEKVVSAVLLGWLIAATVEQLRYPQLQRLRRWDVLGLLPVWTFFAPKPATGDIHLVYRDELSVGGRTIWRELSAPRCASRAAVIWNPDKRYTKALFDVASALADEATKSRGDAIQLSLPYLALLTLICSRAAHDTFAIATQFMVLSDHGLSRGEEPFPVFLSEWHSL